MKVFGENITGFSPYNGLQWGPSQNRARRAFVLIKLSFLFIF